MATKLDEADFSYTDLRRRLVAAAIGTPHPSQPYRQFAGDRREYLREWGITVANHTRAYLIVSAYKEVHTQPADADGRYPTNSTTYIPDLSYGRMVPPTSSRAGTSEVEHLRRYPGNWGVAIDYKGDYIAYLTREDITLLAHTLEHRTLALLDRWQRILRSNAPGIRMRADNYVTPTKYPTGGPYFDATLWTLNGASTDETHLWLHNQPYAQPYIAAMPSGQPVTDTTPANRYRTGATQLPVLGDLPFTVTMPRPESPTAALNPAPESASASASAPNSKPSVITTPASAYQFRSVA